MIRTIEELSMNAWPAAQTILSDGWVLRFSGGYTRRANCVTALYPAEQKPLAKIHLCEAFYRAQELPVVFKLPGRQELAGLDRLLAEEGYAAEAETSVQTLDLGQWKNENGVDVALESSAGEAWHEAFCRLSGMAEKNQAAHRQIIGAILPQTCFAAVIANGQIRHAGWVWSRRATWGYSTSSLEWNIAGWGMASGSCAACSVGPGTRERIRPICR